MQIFIDSADAHEIKALSATQLIDGVTTNPSLVAASGRDYKNLLAEICEYVPGSVSAEVVAETSEDMVRQGLEFHKIAPQITVKLPLTFEGLKACRILTDQNIMVNVTLCFSATQAILAAKAGATYISPFIGRLDDLGQAGLYLIEEICTIYAQYNAFHTKILVASIRSPYHIVEAAKLGAHIVTISPALFKQMYLHPLTEAGVQRFNDDWKKTGQVL